MAIDIDVWLFIKYGEKNEFNIEAKMIIMKGLSKSDVDKVSHCRTIKEILDKLQCLYGGDSREFQEKVEEPYISSSE